MYPSIKRSLATDDQNQSPIKKQKIAFYLADNTPIRTIEVTHFDDDVTAGYLRGYFDSASGPVSDVSIDVKVENKQEIRVGYVTFVLPEDAARIICASNLLESNYKFTIKQADSAHQPKIDPNVTHFEDLNDDCFWHISSYLDLIDIVKSFAHQIYRRRHAKFSFGSTNTGDSSINETNIQEILQEMGSFIHSIEWHRLTAVQLQSLSKSCVNVKELKLINPAKRLHGPDIKKYTKFFRSLTTFQIHGASFFDSTLKMMTTHSKLKSLELNGCSNIRGKFLPTWKTSKLESLKISNNPNFECHNMHTFALKNHLDKYSFDAGCSSQCLALPADCLSKFTELELDFSRCDGEMLKNLNFQGLTRLTHLTLTYKFMVDSSKCDNDLLMAIGHVRTLTSLSIGSIHVNADTFQCLRSLTNLRKIELKRVVNTVGKEMYSSLAVHLPKLTEVRIDMRDPLVVDCKLFVNLLSGLVDLKYVRHSSNLFSQFNGINTFRGGAALFEFH